jgi:hypothetical protein
MQQQTNALATHPPHSLPISFLEARRSRESDTFLYCEFMEVAVARQPKKKKFVAIFFSPFCEKSFGKNNYSVTNSLCIEKY